jgi:hypothetical protein
MREVGLGGNVVAGFDESHAQQVCKKVAVFGSSDLDQDFEHLFDIVAISELALAFLNDKILIGHNWRLSRHGAASLHPVTNCAPSPSDAPNDAADDLHRFP